MRKILFLCLISLPSLADAMSVSEYQDLSKRAPSDPKAALALQAYLSGAAEGVLVAHAISPISGICLPADFKLLPSQIPVLVGPMLATRAYKSRDLSRVPMPKLLVDALSVTHACRP